MLLQISAVKPIVMKYDDINFTISESDEFEDKKIIYDELYICYVARKQKKRETLESFHFSSNAGQLIDELVERIVHGDFKIQSFHQFYIFNPKRLINAPDEVDRLGEFWLCEKYIKPYLKGELSPDKSLVKSNDNLFPRLYTNNVACQKGKGSAEAMRRLAYALSQAHILYGDFYVIQYDIKKFYDNIEHEAAKDLFKELPKCAYTMTSNIIDSYSCSVNTPECYAARKNPQKSYGMPKGTLISQWTGVMLLDPLDRLIDDTDNVLFTMRYCDDCVTLVKTKKDAVNVLNLVKNYLRDNELGIELNEKKTAYYPISRGVNFCGFRYTVMPDHSVIKRILWHKKKEQYGEFKTIQYLYRNEIITFQEAMDRYRGIFAHLNKGDTYRLRRYYQERFYLSHNKTQKKERSNNE